MQEWKIKYDHEADAAYISANEHVSVAKTSESKIPDVLLDYDGDNQLIGIEILGVSRRLLADG